MGHRHDGHGEPVLRRGRPVKVREAIELIEADGWVQVATRGSHRQIGSTVLPTRAARRLSGAVVPLRLLPRLPGQRLKLFSDLKHFALSGRMRQ